MSSTFRQRTGGRVVGADRNLPRAGPCVTVKVASIDARDTSECCNVEYCHDMVRGEVNNGAFHMNAGL